MASKELKAWRSGQDDAALLQRLGYKQELRRDMSFFSNFAVSLSIISILTAVTGQYGPVALTYGGNVSAVWGWPLVCLMSMTVALSMAEICSAFPTCGGLYFWALASWVTGWFNLLGQIAITAGIDFTVAQFIVSFIIVATSQREQGSYTFDQKGLLGIYGGVLAIHGLMNTFSVKVVDFVNTFSGWWHLIGTLGICIALPAIAPTHMSAEWVFTSFADNSEATGISNSVYIFMLGLLMSQWCLTGYDASAHMAEETRFADVAGPIGIVGSVAVSAVFGWGYILALSFSIQTTEDLFSPESATGGTNAVFQIFWDAVEARWPGGGMGSLAFMLIALLAAFFAGASSVASNSRMLYAFSRDRAVPGHQLWARINPTFQAPLNANWAMVIMAFILGLPMLNNSATFFAVTSIATIGLYISYAIPIYLKVFVARKSFVRGPFHLGALSLPINVIAMLWVSFITVLFCLPTIYPITSTTLNYAPVAVGIVVIIAFGWWALPGIGAHKWFTGPPRGELGFGDDDPLSSLEVGRPDGDASLQAGSAGSGQWLGKDPDAQS